MNVSDFTYLLHAPESIKREHIDELQHIINEYPYFQAPRAVYLKGLKNLNSFKYNDALKKTAAYTSDRHILFEFITSELFDQHGIAESIASHSGFKKPFAQSEQQSPAYIVPELELESEQPLPRNQKEAEEILDPELFEPKDPEIATFLANRKAEEEQLQLGEPLSFNKTELHSFSEWLRLTSFQPIQRDSETEKSEADPKKRKFDLIDRFIKSSPKIVPSKEQKTPIDLSSQTGTLKNELMTETLARVYLEQKKYKEAIQAFKILSLKYPEKSGFFADQIRAIKKLQQNN